MSNHAAADALLSGPVVCFNPALSRALGGIAEALMMQQVLYGTKDDHEMWFWHTGEQFRTETTLSDEQQLRARKNLIRLGVLEEKRIGLPAKMHFKVNREKLYQLVVERGRELVSEKPGNLSPANPETGSRETREHKELVKEQVKELSREEETALTGTPHSPDFSKDILDDEASLKLVEDDLGDDPKQAPGDRAAKLLSRYNAVKRSTERLFVLGAAFEACYGHQPDYSRLHALRTNYGVVPVAETIYQFDGKEFDGDPMDYVTSTLAKKLAEGTLGNGNGGVRKRYLKWFPAGYRSNVPDPELTLPEIAIKYKGRTPHAVVERKAPLNAWRRNYHLFEYRAHLCYALIAGTNPDASPGKELVTAYRTALRRHPSDDPEEIERDWNDYCDTFVPEEWRQHVKEMPLP